MEIETGGNYNTILQSVQKKSPPDLEIINHGVSYHCHFNIISIYSKKISSLTNRPTTIELKTKTKLHFLSDVIDFFYGHPIIFDFTNYKEISILASYFEIDNLTSPVLSWLIKRTLPSALAMLLSNVHSSIITL